MSDVKKTYDVKGMHCASCVRVIERKLKKVDGVTDANVNLATNKATVMSHEEIPSDQLVSALNDTSYELVVEEKKADGHAHMVEKQNDGLKENTIISLVMISISAVIMIWELDRKSVV